MHRNVRAQIIKPWLSINCATFNLSCSLLSESYSSSSWVNKTLRWVVSKQQRLNCEGLLRQRAKWRSKQYDICCSLNSHPAASWTLSPSWPPSRSPPCSPSASTPPAAVSGSSDAPLKRPSPSRSACCPPGAAAETWRWHRLQRSAQATQPNGARGNTIDLLHVRWR